MNTQKLHSEMKKSLSNLGQKQMNRTYPDAVTHCFQKFFEAVEAENFPVLLRRDYRQMKTQVDEVAGSSEEEFKQEEARRMVDDFIGLLCEVQTYRSPDDPGERCFEAGDSGVSAQPLHGTDTWRANVSEPPTDLLE